MRCAFKPKTCVANVYGFLTQCVTKSIASDERSPAPLKVASTPGVGPGQACCVYCESDQASRINCVTHVTEMYGRLQRYTACGDGVLSQISVTNLRHVAVLRQIAGAGHRVKNPRRHKAWLDGDLTDAYQNSACRRIRCTAYCAGWLQWHKH